MIRKLANGQYRLYSRKKDPKTGRRRNLGTFATRAAAEKHERAVQFFKRRGWRWGGACGFHPALGAYNSTARTRSSADHPDNRLRGRRVIRSALR